MTICLLAMLSSPVRDSLELFPRVCWSCGCVPVQDLPVYNPYLLGSATSCEVCKTQVEVVRNSMKQMHNLQRTEIEGVQLKTWKVAKMGVTLLFWKTSLPGTSHSWGHCKCGDGCCKLSLLVLWSQDCLNILHKPSSTFCLVCRF